MKTAPDCFMRYLTCAASSLALIGCAPTPRWDEVLSRAIGNEMMHGLVDLQLANPVAPSSAYVWALRALCECEVSSVRLQALRLMLKQARRHRAAYLANIVSSRWVASRLVGEDSLSCLPELVALARIMSVPGAVVGLAIGRVVEMPPSSSRTIALGAILEGGDKWMTKLLYSWRDQKDGASDCLREIGQAASDEEMDQLVGVATKRALDTSLLKSVLDR